MCIKSSRYLLIGKLVHLTENEKRQPLVGSSYALEQYLDRVVIAAVILEQIHQRQGARELAHFRSFFSYHKKTPINKPKKKYINNVTIHLNSLYFD